MSDQANTTNVYRDTEATDYLNNGRAAAAAAASGSTGGNQTTPGFVGTLGDTVQVTDTVSINANENDLSDAIQVTDTFTEVDYPSGSSSLAGDPTKKKLWLQFNNDVLDNSTNGNDGTITYHSSLKALYFSNAYGNINDATTNGRNLTLGAGTIKYVRGKEGTAISLDGSTYYTGSDSGLPTGTNPFSFSFWIYGISFATTPYLIQYGSGSGSTVAILSGTGGVLNFNNGSTITAISTSAISLNKWTFVTITYDGTNARVYFNGILDKTTAITVNTTLGGASALSLGANPSGVEKLTGYFNQVRFYNIALSQAQISALYMVGVIGSCHTFDGGEYVATTLTPFNWERTQSYSVSFWAKFTDNGVKGIMGNSNAGQGWSIDTNVGTVELMLRNTANTNELRVQTVATFNDGNWHHFVITYSGNSLPSGVQIYADGVLQTLNTLTNNLSATTVAGTALGIGSFGTSTLPYIGQIDDVQIWQGYIVSQAETNYLFAKKDGWQVEDDADFQPLWLSFDQDYVDKSGNNNVGTLTGTETYVAGPKTKNAFSFDGATKITYSDAGFPSNNQPFSVAMWINPTTISSGQQLISFWGNEAIGQGLFVALCQTSPGTVDVDIYGGSILHSQTLITPNVWTHIVVTSDGTTTKIYINGVLDNNTLNHTYGIVLNHVRLSGYSGGGNYTGSLYDLQFWNYALSQADINLLTAGLQIMHNPVVPTPIQSDFCEVLA